MRHPVVIITILPSSLAHLKNQFENPVFTRVNSLSQSRWYHRRGPFFPLSRVSPRDRRAAFTAAAWQPSSEHASTHDPASPAFRSASALALKQFSFSQSAGIRFPFSGEPAHTKNRAPGAGGA
jgi:hypothetical protein